MINSKLWLSSLAGTGIALSALAAIPQPAAAQVFNPETFTLDNGMQVVVVNNPAQPAVNHMVWYKVGAADEPRGASGIAHFLEHMMFRGTRDIPDGEFSRLVQREGARSNAFTSWDYTAYFQSVALDRLGTMMELEADRMANLQIDPEVFEPERGVIIEERGQVVDNRPASRMSEQMNATLYQNHPYGIPIIGWEHEIANLSVADAEAFYEAWYAPNNAVLILSGNIDAETARPLVERTYGQVPPRPVPERVRPREPEKVADMLVVQRSDQVRVPTWQRLIDAPSYSVDPEGHAYALQVLAEILGGGETSRLYERLVVDQEIASSAGAGYSPYGLDSARFSLYATPRGEAGVEDLGQAIDAEIARLLEEGVTEDEVARAVRRLSTGAIFARDSLMAPGYSFGLALTTGGSVDDVETWPDRIEAVDAAAVNAAAQAVLGDARGTVTGHLLPADPALAAVPDAPLPPEAAAPPGPEEVVR